MSNEDRDALLAQFQSITGLDDAGRATFFLEASNWNVDLAISSFFDDPDGAVNVEPQPINPNASVSQPPTDESSEQFKSTTPGNLKLHEMLCFLSRTPPL